MVAVALVAMAPSAQARVKRAAVVIYDGIGTTARARLWGRALEDKGLDRPRRKERWYRRVKRSVRLFESDEIPHALIELTVLGKRHRVKADKEGLFSLELRDLKRAGKHPVSAQLVGWRAAQRTVAGWLHVFPTAATVRAAGGRPVAVISDIDDTVLDSQVTSKRKLVWRVLTSNATRLQTFKGAPGLYQRLSRRGYPIVFVSGSPMNLYPRLQTFLQLRRFPRAPLRLKNVGLSAGSDSLFEQKRYKLRQIEALCRLLPGYRLILIGDSGEKDPEIYRELVRRKGKAVLATLIHRVTDESPRAPRFAGQLLFRSYQAASTVLAERGLVDQGAR